MFGCMKPPDNPAAQESKINEELLKAHFKAFKSTIQLLLLGTGESGKTTILKQVKILHINGFSNEEKLEKIPAIKQNIHESIHAIISASSRIDPPVEIKDSQVKRSADYILNMGPQEPSTWTNEYVDHVKTLWANSDVQEVYKRSNEYQLIDSAQHFLDLMDEIRKDDYIPTVQDILFCRVTTTTISKIDFNVKAPKTFGGGMARFSMYDVGGQRGHRKKWISVFDGIQAILFLIAASDFDQTLREEETVNRLAESFQIFQDIFWSRFARDAGMIVFLNKQDLLKKKIENGKKIENYFPDYANYSLANGSSDQSEYERAKHYLKQKIIDITQLKPKDDVFYIFPDMQVPNLQDREVFIHFTTATDTNNIKLVFNDVHDLIFNWNIRDFVR